MELAFQIIDFLKTAYFNPQSIVEPTCGKGSFVLASLKSFPEATIFGMDINEDYIHFLSKQLKRDYPNSSTSVSNENFFSINWKEFIRKIGQPVLIIGNPPWITSSEMSSIHGSNLPEKENLHNLLGIEALTGKSNFDISEWMIIQLLKALNSTSGTLAMLCKVSVVRKVLKYCSEKKLTIFNSSLFLIDSKKYFNASVEACLFICQLLPDTRNYSCKKYADLSFNKFLNEFGYLDNNLIANFPLYYKWKHLIGESTYQWRSGIKHDKAKVMEIKFENNQYFNGFGEEVNLEKDYIFPMLKSSDLANNRITQTNKWMIVPQQIIGQETDSIKELAPLTWNYLLKYSSVLDSRGSSIYKNRPRFSIFGVGEYSFAKYKIAISGFYKRLNFQLIEPLYNKPVVFDDTCYFIPLDSYEEALELLKIFNHQITKAFFESFIFWDSKRPITKEILQKLDITKIKKIL